jgi:hypothetical protein
MFEALGGSAGDTSTIETYEAGLTEEQIDTIVSGLVSGKDFDTVVSEMELSGTALSVAEE